MKYILLAVLCLVLGYSASLFFPAKEIGLSDLQNEVNQFKGVTENKEESAEIPEPKLATYAANSFLVESDFVSVPGELSRWGFVLAFLWIPLLLIILSKPLSRFCLRPNRVT